MDEGAGAGAGVAAPPCIPTATVPIPDPNFPNPASDVPALEGCPADVVEPCPAPPALPLPAVDAGGACADAVKLKPPKPELGAGEPAAAGDTPAAGAPATDSGADVLEDAAAKLKPRDSTDVSAAIIHTRRVISTKRGISVGVIERVSVGPDAGDTVDLSL